MNRAIMRLASVTLLPLWKPIAMPGLASIM